MTKSTVQTVTILAGVGVLITARLLEKPVFIWPGIVLMVIGVSLKYMRGGR